MFWTLLVHYRYWPILPTLRPSTSSFPQLFPCCNSKVLPTITATLSKDPTWTLRCISMKTRLTTLQVHHTAWCSRHHVRIQKIRCWVQLRFPIDRVKSRPPRRTPESYLWVVFLQTVSHKVLLKHVDEFHTTRLLGVISLLNQQQHCDILRLTIIWHFRSYGGGISRVLYTIR